MEPNPGEPKPVRTLSQHLRQGFVAAHRRRPVSFYLLLSIPVVLLLAAHLFESREDPRRLALGLSLLFIFLGVLLTRAIIDVLQLTRTLVSEHRKSYQETLGDERFMEALRAGRSDRRED